MICSRRPLHPDLMSLVVQSLAMDSVMVGLKYFYGKASTNNSNQKQHKLTPMCP